MTQSRATLYRRVSTEEQREGTSLGAQLDMCTSYLDGNGWTLAADLVDECISGATLDRHALQAALNARPRPRGGSPRRGLARSA